MNLLSFRTPVLYAVCHRCGNALTHGEDECPHCGTNQSRALRAPNSVDFNTSNVMMMPGRMLVPYPSVPEEVDAAMNIARERARVARRVAFGVAGGGLLAVALALNYAPGLRSPVVQRLAALPEPARTPAFVPVATDTAPKAAAPASTTTVVAAAKPANPVSVPAATRPAMNLATHPAATYATAPAPKPTQTQAQAPTQTQALAQTQTQTLAQAPTQSLAQIPTPAPMLTSVRNQATEMIASITNKLTTAAVAVRAEISALAMSPATGPVNQAALNAPAPITATTAANAPNTPSSITAPVSTTPTTTSAVTLAPKNPTPTAQDTPITPPSAIATTAPSPSPAINAPARLATLPPAPSPSAVADVPIASHAPQPSAPAEQELPKLSLPPVSPVIATERPPLGSPGESLYFARLALVTNDLNAVHKNLANLPANQVNSPDVQRIRDDLAQREAARDTAMRHARTCDQSASWRCARRYAKDALAIDSSYNDSRVFLKHVAIKIAEAKKAAELAQAQSDAIMQRGPLHPAPIREAVAVPRTAPVANVGSAPTTVSTPPHLFANPVVRAPRETHVTHEVRETHVQQEVREPVVAFQPVQNTDTASSESRKAPDDGAPIRPPGRGEAH